MTRVDSPVPLMHYDPDRSWVTDPDPDHPKGTHPKFISRRWLSGMKWPRDVPNHKDPLL